jgi:phage host-nuclease inhibitor protein Gam
MLASAGDFDIQSIYLFARLNEVVFSEQFFERLRVAAEKEREEKREREEKKEKQDTLEQLLERSKREIVRLQERYEDKLAGVQRKYQTDVDALKKQVRSLQQKLTLGL